MQLRETYVVDPALTSFGATALLWLSPTAFGATAPLLTAPPCDTTDSGGGGGHLPIVLGSLSLYLILTVAFW